MTADRASCSADLRRPARRGAILLALLLLAGCGHLPTPIPAVEAAPRALGGADCALTSGYDVVIVGAGLAGLVAGRELRRLGRSVLLLEAEERIGGRGFVGQIAVEPGEAPVPIDYGGAWIHGVATNPLTGVVDAMGFERVRSILDAPYYREGRRATTEEQASFDAVYEAYEEALGEAAARIEHEAALVAELCAAGEQLAVGESTANEICGGVDALVPELCTLAQEVERGNVDAESFCSTADTAIRVTSDVAADYVPRDDELASVTPLLLASAGPLETAAELTASSALDAAAFAAGEDDFVDRGLGTFVTRFGEGLPVCLDSPVRRIEYGEDGVVLEAAGRRYQAAKALVTVSVGVLRAGTIEFAPPLPEWKREAIDGLQMGHMQKVIIPFREDIFDDVEPNTWVLAASAVTPAERELARRQGRALGSAEQRVMAFVLKPLGTPLAIGFYGGERAAMFEAACRGIESTSGPRSASGCDDPAIDTAVATLAEIYGAETVGRTMLPAGIHLTRWSLEPHTLGAYSVPSPGSWDQRAVLGLPVSGGTEGDGPPRLYFAGEASSRAIYNGSYAGAWETGLAAAREIHADLLATAGD